METWRYLSDKTGRVVILTLPGIVPPMLLKSGPFYPIVSCNKNRQMEARQRFIKVNTIFGPWFSLGIHIDFKHRHIDFHFVWWIVIIGNTIEPVRCGYCGAELVGGEDCQKCMIDFVTTQGLCGYPPLVTGDNSYIYLYSDSVTAGKSGDENKAKCD